MRIDGSDVSVDWEQARLNGGNYCFYLESDGRLCGRADRWLGHHEPMSPVHHPFVKIGTVFADLEAARWSRDAIAKHAIRLEEQIAELKKDRERIRREMHELVGYAFGRGAEHQPGPVGPVLLELSDMVDAAMAAEREG